MVVCFNAFHECSLKSVYTILVDKKNNTTKCNCINNIRDMVKQQGSMFPKSSDYNYRKVFDDKNVSKLQTYFDTELLQVLSQITRGKAKNKHTIIDEKKKLKLMMVCALLVNLMDHRKCFMQTLVGLGCYAQGLRDKCSNC